MSDLSSGVEPDLCECGHARIANVYHCWTPTCPCTAYRPATPSGGA